MQKRVRFQAKWRLNGDISSQAQIAGKANSFSYRDLQILFLEMITEANGLNIRLQIFGYEKHRMCSLPIAVVGE